jgi:hypothetical protein
MIEVSPSTFIWLSVIAVAIWRRSWLITAVFISSIFQQMSFLNFYRGPEPDPLPVYYVLASICILYLLLQLGQRKINLSIPKELRPFVATLAAFAAYAAVSLTFPLAFQHVGVYGPGLGYEDGLIRLSTPELSLSLIAQLVYVSANCLLVFLLLLAATARSAAQAAVQAVILGGALVVLLCCWQFLHRISGIYFPADIIYTSQRLALHDAQSLGYIPRINGPFGEPSFAAAYLIGMFTFSLRLWIDKRTGGVAFLALGSLVALLLTTSTTAYIALLIVLTGFLYQEILRPAASQKQLPRTTVYLGLFLVVMFAMIAVLLTTPAAQTVLEGTLEKSQTGSWNERTASDRRALGIFFETFTLGIGIGANIPSSFAMHLLSNVGLPGTLLFFGSLVLLTKAAYRSARATVDSDARLFLRAAVHGLWGHVVARVIAVPTTSFAALWIWIALVAMLTAYASARPARISDGLQYASARRTKSPQRALG